MRSVRLTRQHLTRMDVAREADTATSYNTVDGVLLEFLQQIRAGASVVIESGRRRLVISDEADFRNWALGRYPASRLRRKERKR
jgi:hypothetical protein